MTRDELELANEIDFKIKKLNDFLQLAKKSEVIELSSGIMNRYGELFREQHIEFRKNMKDSLIGYLENEVLRFEKQLEEL